MPHGGQQPAADRDRAGFAPGMTAGHGAGAWLEAEFARLNVEMRGFSVVQLPLYAEGATGPHAKDFGFVVGFRRG